MIRHSYICESDSKNRGLFKMSSTIIDYDPLSEMRSGVFNSPPPNFHSSAPAFMTDVAQPKGQ